MAARKKPVSAPAAGAAEAVASFTYPAKRRNIPPAGLEAQGVVRESPRVRYEYNPHLPPVLRSSDQPGEADRLPELLAIAVSREWNTPVRVDPTDWALPSGAYGESTGPT